MGWSIFLVVLGIIGIFDALVVLLFPKAIRKWTLQLVKKPKKLKKVALIEIIVAIIFLLLGILLKKIY